MGIEIVQVDAFASAPFTGNPAAVCVFDELPSATWRQNVAREMNLSETAFVIRREDGAFDLTWFTPSTEVDLCGHATLASAHVLWQDAHLPLDRTARFHTRSGVLICQREGDWIRMDFPAERPTATVATDTLVDALDHTPVFVGRNRMDMLVELENEAAVRAASPNLHALGALNIRGLILTAAADEDRDYDFVSRFFAPAAGVDEDPVTGSAHCCLAPYWTEKLGRDTLTGYQASARGGFVNVEMHGDRVHLLGQAITVMRSSLLVPYGDS
ncbi:MAG: PhzF family phenazine biosynthesis protein [Acidobacteriota bacterium]